MSIYTDYAAALIILTDAEQLANDYSAAAQKTNAVLCWIEANNRCGDARQLVDAFDLAWSLERDYGNGIAKVGFYTDESLRFQILALHLSTTEWFRA